MHATYLCCVFVFDVDGHMGEVLEASKLSRPCVALASGSALVPSPSVVTPAPAAQRLNTHTALTPVLPRCFPLRRLPSPAH
eukprot:scaffold24046_cov120-Isochrysis_galbana.AAC.2